ncbi:MAG TPA: ribosome small subunit-dependent GTPase A [Actinomycetes bacterium]|nr:ribosome small subunit-dependent GTPase A [Actinomycetes bacterium]
MSGLERYGWDRGWADTLPEGTRPARVVRADRGRLLLVSDAGEEVVDAVADATAGDWVALGPPATRVLPRRSALRRASASGRSTEQVLAANVDVVAVTVSLALDPNLARVERLLTLAWDSGAVPAVVLTKADLAPDAEDVASDVAAAAPGVAVLIVSALTGRGLDEVRALLPAGRTAVLVGQSGVGKSTLVNALAGDQLVAVAGIGSGGKGRHTTTSRELLPLPWGAVLLDTPGLRGVGLIDADEGFARAFPEIEELAEQCRFNDCAHATEPGCAVLAAVEGGTLAWRRLESWRKLERELAYAARRVDARLAAEERARWKALGLEVRRSGRIRP